MTTTTFHAKIDTHSVNEHGQELITAVLTFPRVVLSEFNTHRVFSRNSASSRAVPVAKNIRNILEHPYIPPKVGLNQAGMQAKDYLDKDSEEYAQWLDIYLEQRTFSALNATRQLVGDSKLVQELMQKWYDTRGVNMNLLNYILDDYTQGIKKDGKPSWDYLNIHKQHVNRVLEPFMWHTVVVTSNTFSNFIALRNHPDADPAIEEITKLFVAAQEKSTPTLLKEGQWHLPLLLDDERAVAQDNPLFWADVSTGRCARTSYLTHHGVRDVDLDIMLAKERLAPHGHMSPFEHPACSAKKDTVSGNFIGYTQYRKSFEYEDDFSKVLASRAGL